MNVQKQKIRIAQISGYVIRKRCRKKEFELIDGVGLTNEEALQKLKENFEEAKQNWKEANFPLKAIVYDATRQIYDTHSTVMRPLMPNGSDNVESFDFIG